MLLDNVRYADGNFNLVQGNIFIDNNGIIVDDTAKCSNSEKLRLDDGCIVLPGFIDIHTHGCGGADTGDAKASSLETMSLYHARHGVTSFCPTTMTEGTQKLLDVFTAVSDYSGHEPGAYMHGINMEGPYISVEKCGAQPKEYIRKPSLSEFCLLNNIFKICLVDVAPEVEDAAVFAINASMFCTVSVAHTNADYHSARLAFSSGFTHATHLFNAMTGMTSRQPGVVGAVLDGSATAELICDGFHVSPPMLRIAFNALGRDRAVVVSDSMRSAGCADGEYMLANQKVFVKDGKARLADGTIAASTSNLHEEFLNLLDYGIAFETALRACTINPARVIGVSKYTGSIETGKKADLLILDKSFNIHTVIVGGRVVYTA